MSTEHSGHYQYVWCCVVPCTIGCRYLYCILIFLRGNNITIKKICIFVVFQGSADVVYVDMKWDGNELSVALFANNAAGPPLNTPVLYPFTGELSYTGFRFPRPNTKINFYNGYTF